jgi:DNA-binding IclR family transcriptional regulator
VTTTDSGAERTPGVKSVIFALEILEFVAQSQSFVGVTELARAFGTTKSRIHRHLRTLVSAGYLMRESETERYGASARLIALGHAVSEGFELVTVARSLMRSLRDTVGSAVTLSVPDAEGVRIIHLISGKSNVEISVKPGSLLSWHNSAQGKLALAYGSAELQKSVLEGKLEKTTEWTLSDPAALLADLDHIRERGWAAAPNEATHGLNAIAAPIFDARGRFLGAIALVDLVQALPAEPPPGQLEPLITTAKQISYNCGSRGDGHSL